MQISIPIELVEQIEHYDYECQSREKIIEKIINSNDFHNSELLKFYQQDYDKKFYLFEKLKNQLQQEYILPNLTDEQKNNYIWNLDYYTNIVTISF